MTSVHLPSYRLPIWVVMALLVWIASRAPADATTMVRVSDETLIRQAELSVLATVSDRWTAITPQGLMRLSTHYEMVVDQVIKGSLTGSRIVVSLPGGTSKDGREELVVWGTPDLRDGERVLLFLEQGGDGAWRVLHLTQGLFREVAVGGQGYLMSPLGSGPDTDLDLWRHGARFSEWLRRIERGESVPPDYWVPRPEGAVVEPPQDKFTLLRGLGIRRWTEFDRGESVSWYRHEDGQPGLRDGGKRAFKRALRAWGRRKTATPIRLRSAGVTFSRQGFNNIDGRNTMIFNSRRATPYDCATGGVIAIGGLHGIQPNPSEWKGQPAEVIFEAEILINRGVECLFGRSPSIALQAYVHELGHTLGLGHSCGDSITAPCSSSELLASSTMAAVVQPSGFGARLSEDDVAAARFLYDPDSTPVPCALPPGHGRFCQVCGPCGEGQGRCRRQSDCQDGLRCEQGVGADFGFEPQVGVCVVDDQLALQGVLP